MNSSERRWQTLSRSRENKIELTAYDDLFETDQNREEAKVLMKEDMEQLVDSMRGNMQDIYSFFTHFATFRTACSKLTTGV